MTVSTPKPLVKIISLCPSCFCMTKTIKGKCGKCKQEKLTKLVPYEMGDSVKEVVSEWTPSALKYWQMPGKTLKVVVGSIGGGRSEHIGVIKRFRQDEDFYNEGMVEFEDGEKMYSTQGQWFEFSEQTPTLSETNKADYLKEFDEFSVAKRFTDYPLISINDYVSTLSEIKKLFVSSIERARREGGNELIKELREYHDKYPDADWNDLIGYIVGWRSRYDKA